MSNGSITWDGPDGDASSLNPTGLGGVDYSGAGSSGVFSFEITSWDLVDPIAVDYTLDVYTNANAASTQTVTVTSPPQPVGALVRFPISGFAPSAGGGADFSHVGAIVLRFVPSDHSLDSGFDNVMAPCPRAATPPPGAAQPPPAAGGQPPVSGPPPPVGRERPNLRVSKRASKKRVRAGRKVPWVLTVRNRGDATARNVRLCDRLNRRLTVVNRRGGKLVEGNSVCWTIRRIAPGKTTSRSLTVRIDRDAPKGRLVNRASVTSKGLPRRRARASVSVLRVRQNRPPSRVTG